MSKWIDLIPKPRSKFIRVKCSDCGNEKIVFDSATSVVKCDICDALLAEPSSGKAKIRGEVVGILN